MNAPCKECPKRTPDCHAGCEDYQAWSSEHQKMIRSGDDQKAADDVAAKNIVWRRIWHFKNDRRK